jgi:hypothetical protein
MMIWSHGHYSNVRAPVTLKSGTRDVKIMVLWLLSSSVTVLVLKSKGFGR